MNGEPWTQDELRYLFASVGAEPLQDVAARLGRSHKACIRIIEKRGGGIKRMSGMLTLNQVARRCNRRANAVWLWTKRGLETHRTSRGRGGFCLVDPFDLQEFLLSHRNILAGLDPFARRRIGLTVFDVAEIDAEARKAG